MGDAVLRGATALSLEFFRARVSAPAFDAVSSDYGFLLGSLVDQATLERAEALAERWGVHPHEVLIATGWVGAEDYARALAEHLGLPFRLETSPDDFDAGGANLRACIANGLIRRRRPGAGFVLSPEHRHPREVVKMAETFHPLTLAPPESVRKAIRAHFAEAIAHAAVDELSARRPEESARQNLARWQLYAPALGVALLLAGLLADAEIAVRTLAVALALLFVPVIALRLVALRDLMRGRKLGQTAAARTKDAELPVYTILVALYREAKVLPGLLRGLAKFDYPAAKLDIKIVLEACDAETIAAASALDLPANVEIVVVPELLPRTKPRALNYALPLARGEYLVIYDAEDRPEPDQLRKAVAAFRDGPPNLACLQGRLNLYNADENWLTRQFTIEYCALFEGLLPTLDRLDLPFPLGGSSNHFRVSALKWLLAWDPYNVTEDADLGARLARSGYQSRMLDSTTHEEAPCRFMMWLRQRTRWLKGYMQTWLVHMRDPVRLWRELGPWGFTAFQIMIGGTVLSALVHPWFYVLAGLDLASGAFGARPESLLGLPFWTMAWINLAAGYVAAFGVGLLAVRQRGYRFLLRQIPLMPFYWLLISVAAYRAAWQFASARRFQWEKTEHGVTSAPPFAA
jgi:cellulose synthase/poly-beta-1,6-N-acetylglucosamine synthase-like glycosyltransferase